MYTWPLKSKLISQAELSTSDFYTSDINWHSKYISKSLMSCIVQILAIDAACECIYTYQGHIDGGLSFFSLSGGDLKIFLVSSIWIRLFCRPCRLLKRLKNLGPSVPCTKNSPRMVGERSQGASSVLHTWIDNVFINRSQLEITSDSINSNLKGAKYT